jgi:hypothetical protein
MNADLEVLRPIHDLVVRRVETPRTTDGRGLSYSAGSSGLAGPFRTR